MSKILHITDLHILPAPEACLLGVETEKYFRQVLKHAHQKHGRFDLLLLTGDLAQDPCPESYRRIQQILSRYETPSLCLPGNHDDFAQMRTILNHAPVSCQPRKQLENWQIIALKSQIPGSPGGLLSKDELEYLSDQLRRHPDLFTLIAVHHHCIASDSSWMDAMMIKNSAELFAVLAPYSRVKVILCGHVHQVLEKEHNSIALYSTPASCFQFKPGCKKFALDDKPPGYRVLELRANGMIQTQIEWLPVQLNELDFNSAGY